MRCDSTIQSSSSSRACCMCLQVAAQFIMSGIYAALTGADIQQSVLL